MPRADFSSQISETHCCPGIRPGPMHLWSALRKWMCLCVPDVPMLKFLQGMGWQLLCDKQKIL